MDLSTNRPRSPTTPPSTPQIGGRQAPVTVGSPENLHSKFKLVLIGSGSRAPTPAETDLYANAERIRTYSRENPITPIASDCKTPVFSCSASIFKPGKPEARLASLCYQIACAAGMEDVVPCSIEGSATVYLKSENYTLLTTALTSSKKQILVDKESLYKTAAPEQVEGEKALYCCIKGSHFRLTPLQGLPGSYTVDPTYDHSEDSIESDSDSESSDYESSDDSSYSGVESEYDDSFEAEFKTLFKEEPLVIAKGSNNKWYLVPANDHYPIEKDDNGRLIAVIEGENYEITDKKNRMEITGHNVSGLVQEFISNTTDGIDIFLDTPQSPLHGAHSRYKRCLDLRSSESPFIAPFFEKVSMSGYIDAFLAIMLLKHPDAKSTNLLESNILYQKHPSGDGITLVPKLIDLAGTLGVSNKFLPDAPGVHVIRNGLMAFPHASSKLSADQTALIKGRIKSLIENENELRSDLFSIAANEQIFGEANWNAFAEIVHGIDKFIDTRAGGDAWSLEDLFFAIFPEYHDQWKELDAQGFSRVNIASEIGTLTVPEIISKLANK